MPGERREERDPMIINIKSKSAFELLPYGLHPANISTLIVSYIPRGAKTPISLDSKYSLEHDSKPMACMLHWAHRVLFVTT